MIIKHTHHSLQIIFAVLIGYLLITKLFISWVQYAPDSFIESVEWATDSDISFDKIEIQQGWLGFQFQTQNLTVKDAKFDLSIQQLDMDINLFSMLIPKLKYGEYLIVKQAVYQQKEAVKTVHDFEKGLSADHIEKLTEINLDISQLWQRVKVSDVVFKALFDPDLTVHLYDYQSLSGSLLNVVSEFGVAYKKSLNFERFGFKSSFETNILGKVIEGELNLFSLYPLRVEALAQLWPLALKEKLPKGELLFDLQAQIFQSKISQLTLNLNAQSLKWAQKNSTLPQHLGVELIWESTLQNSQSNFMDWTFRLSKIQLENQYIQNISPIELGFEENQILTFRSDYFDIEPLKVIVQSLVTNPHISALFDKTSGLAIESLQGQFNWKSFQLPKLEMTIKKLMLPATDYPGIALHDLTLLKNKNKFILTTDQPMVLSGLNLPKGGVKIELPNKIYLKHSISEGAWVLTPLHFTIDKMPVTLTATGSTEGNVDANLLIEVGTMQTLKQYLPYELFSPELQAWLNMALVEGKNINGRVQLKGALKDFPFQDGSGTFKVKASVENAFIKFDSDWPMLEDFTGQIEFTPYQLKVTSPRIYVGEGAYAQEVEVVIDHLDQENIALVFKGHVQTQLNRGISYLTSSPLAGLLGLEGFIENTKFGGNIDVTLDQVWIPLSGYSNQAETVSGQVTFKNATMTLFDSIPIEQIKGTLAFTEKGVTANKLTAKAFSHNSRFSVKTLPKNETIFIQGEGRLLSAKNPFFDSSIPWNLRVDIPLNSKNSSDVDIQVEVPFAKANSLLPAPFNSRALKDKALKVNIDVAKKSLSMNVDLPELLAAKGYWKEIKSQYQVQQVEVLLGEEAKRGFASDKQLHSYIRGDLGGVNLDDWMNTVPNLGLDSIWDKGSSSLDWMPSWITVDSLMFREHAYPNVRMEWLKRNLKTVLQIKSSDVLANVVIKPHSPIEMSVERLRLHALDTTVAESKKNQTLCQSGSKSTFLWPEVLFTGKQIELSGYLVDSLQFHLMDSSSRLTISDLNGAFGKGAGTLTGQYLFDKGSNKSTLSLALRSKKVEELLRFIQLKQGFTGKKAKVDTTLSWTGALECFSSKAAIGQVNFELEEGMIEDIEPGFARLIGLLSVESLARRLKLDLKDVTNKGMVYDQIKGQAQLKSGVLQLDSFGLKAPSASVALFGQVDLLKETFKLKAYVTPTIGAAIPTIAALAGYANPLAALAVYSVMKVLPGVNENLVTFRYNVTGPWENPKVSELKSNLKKKSQPLFEVEDSILDTQQ